MLKEIGLCFQILLTTPQGINKHALPIIVSKSREIHFYFILRQKANPANAK